MLVAGCIGLTLAWAGSNRVWAADNAKKPKAKNEIKNPGFEDDFDLPSPLVSRIKYAHKGLCSAELTANSDPKKPYFLSPGIPLEGKERFTVGAWTLVKEEESLNLLLRLWYEDANGKRCSVEPWDTVEKVENAWTHHTVTADKSKWPEDAARVRLYIFWLGDKGVTGSGTAYLDDLSLRFE